jgi:Zn-dependent alcohol dehydrogenase
MESRTTSGKLLLIPWSLSTGYRATHVCRQPVAQAVVPVLLLAAGVANLTFSILANLQFGEDLEQSSLSEHGEDGVLRVVGVRCIVLSSSDDKLERARKLGASDLINYRNTPDWHLAVQEITQGEGATFWRLAARTQTIHAMHRSQRHHCADRRTHALQAFERMAEQSHFGKLVLNVAGARPPATFA